jgi:hypothetical protein
MANVVKLLVATELGDSIHELRKVRGEFGHMQREATTTGDHIRGALKGGIIVGAAAAGVAIAGVTEELKKSFEAASNYEVAQRKLQRATTNAGVSWKKYGARIDETITKQADLSGFMRTDLDDSFQRLVTVTGSASKSFKEMHDAMDLSRATGISLSRASILVAKVQEGSNTALQRYGIQLGKVTTAEDKLKASHTTATAAQIAAAKAADQRATAEQGLAALQQKFGGQAAAYASTSQGELQRFHVSVEELQTTLGRVLLPLVTKVFGTFADWMNQLQQSKTVRDAFNAGVQAMAVVVKAVGRVMSDVVAWVRQHWPEIQQAMRGVLDWAKTNLLPVWRSVIGGVRQIALNLVDAVKSNWPDIKKTAQIVWQTLGPILHDIAIIIKQVVIPAIVLLSRAIKPALKIVLFTIQDTFKVAGPILTNAAKLITGILTAAVRIARALPGVWNTIRTNAVGAWRSIVNTVEGWMNKLISGWDWVVDHLHISGLHVDPITIGGGGGGSGGAGAGRHNPGRPTGAAALGVVAPRPGGALMVGEAGHPEAVLSMNPAHAERTFQLMGQVAQHIIGQTRQMSLGGITGAIGSGLGAVKSAAGSALGFLNPLSHLPGLPSFGGPLAGLGHSIASKLLDAVKNKVESVAGSFLGGGGGGAPHIPGVAGLIGSTFAPGEPSPTPSVLGWIRAAMAATQTPPKAAYIGGLLARAWQESGWNPHAINLWDSNARAGHPSEGWFQTIGPTFASYALPGHGDIWNPVDNAIAAIRYMRAAYQGNLVGYTGAGYGRGGVVGAGSGLPAGTPISVGAHVGETISPRGAGATIIVHNYWHSVDLTDAPTLRRVASQMSSAIMLDVAQQAGR